MMKSKRRVVHYSGEHHDWLHLYAPANAHYAHAAVTTDGAPRYVKQLASHFGHKAAVSMEAEGPRIALTGGSCLLVASDNSLELHALSETAEGLRRIQGVIGSHLERFGQREGLAVAWPPRT
jgi:hypothetical protein